MNDFEWEKGETEKKGKEGETLIHKFELNVVKKENWPSPQLRKAVIKLHSKKPENSEKLTTNVKKYDKKTRIELAERFRPDIWLQGLHLRREKASSCINC